MSDGSVTLAVGSRRLYDGDLVEVTEFDGAQVTVRVERTNRFRTLGVGRLVTACKTVDLSTEDDDVPMVGTALAALTASQRAEVPGSWPGRGDSQPSESDGARSHCRCRP